jgi:hypothetical protein
MAAILLEHDLGEPKTKVEITVSCDQLRNRDATSKSDPCCLLYMQTNNHWQEVRILHCRVGEHEFIKCIVHYTYRPRYIATACRAVVGLHIYSYILSMNSACMYIYGLANQACCQGFDKLVNSMLFESSDKNMPAYMQYSVLTHICIRVPKFKCV